jgi:hypothetical protein
LIYVTGDTHGDLEKFNKPAFKNLTKGDVLIICGDFGFIWNNSWKERAALRKLSAKEYTIAFVDGCHENFDLLEEYPIIEWNGGTVHSVRRNIVHLMRGQIYDIQDKRIFTFGGGVSQDYDMRYDSMHWWERERPSHEEILNAIQNLDDKSNSVDYIITHEPPASLKDCLGVDVLQKLEVHAFFEDIVKLCSYKKWFFGKCHIDRHIPLKFYAVFNSIIPLE